VLGAAYVGLVLAGQALFSSVAGGSSLAIAASMLVVAALFRPLRSRLQALLDRRFYRHRYERAADARRILGAAAPRGRAGRPLRRSQAVVDETVQPAHVSLWLRDWTRVEL
jgi:hypothetical protein